MGNVNGEVKALEVRGLVKRYARPGLFGDREGLTALHGVDLEVRPGEVVGLIGESGCGKSTLTLCALGLLPFDEGEIAIMGRGLQGLGAKGMRSLRKRAQILFQDPDSMLNPAMTVRQHLAESAALHQPGEPEGVVVAEAAARVSLSHRLDALPGSLSGGEKRRAGVARVLISNPRLLVADEPTAGLDAALKADIIDLITRSDDPTRAVLLVSHDLPMVTYACKRVVVMYRGRVVERFAVEGMESTPHHPYTEHLLHSAGMGELSPRAKSDDEGEGAVEGQKGCDYASICHRATSRCHRETPQLLCQSEGHEIACLYMVNS